MSTYQVLGIGNAIVDVISQCEDGFLNAQAIDKGVMQLINQDRAEALYGAMENRTQSPGGSVANTIAGLGALGLTTGLIGRVADDPLGHYYAKSLQDAGTDFINAPQGSGMPTSRSMIFVTPDAERSMNTYLGVSTELDSDDVDEAAASSAALLLLEGYLYDKPKGKAALARAAKFCRAGGGSAGISLSDPFCVDRHRDDFKTLIKDLSFVIGNHDEWLSLYETDDLQNALTLAAADAPLIVCTKGGDGVTVAKGAERIDVAVTKITPTDTTGAGDQFAAGFLYGMATGASLEISARMGGVCAAEVITHYGARPETDIMSLFKSNGLV